MKFFWSKVKSENEPDTNQPVVTEIALKKEYRFMYENFVISSQQQLYLLLEENKGIIDVLRFDPCSIYKYGYPNDEVPHPLQRYGLGFYGFFEVRKSKWIEEIKANNRSHSRHSDSLFEKDRHFIAKFKDVTLEVIADGYQEIQMTREELNEIIATQLYYINCDEQ